ncbi:MAG: 3'-5' exonuclease [Gammaproteobacteria bacterium]|nr:3'-5' exonuclease [Gammaproteobacteria bacterium]
MTDTIAILDFETTGLAPDRGDRATEVAVLLVDGDSVVERFSTLINPKRSIGEEASRITGITDQMVRSAPSFESVAPELDRLLTDKPVVAHYASFDKKVLHHEFLRLGRTIPTKFFCSCRIARRVYQGAPNHKLGSLAHYLCLDSSFTGHRALADTEMTFRLLQHMRRTLKARHDFPLMPIRLLLSLQDVTRSEVESYINRYKKRQNASRTEAAKRASSYAPMEAVGEESRNPQKLSRNCKQCGRIFAVSREQTARVVLCGRCQIELESRTAKSSPERPNSPNPVTSTPSNQREKQAGGQPFSRREAPTESRISRPSEDKPRPWKITPDGSLVNASTGQTFRKYQYYFDGHRSFPGYVIASYGTPFVPAHHVDRAGG